MNTEYKEKLKKIYNYIGEDQQKQKLVEEIYEFLNTTTEDDEYEEMCDMWVVLTSLLLQRESFTDHIINYKIHRTLKRMRKGYYKKGE